MTTMTLSSFILYNRASAERAAVRTELAERAELESRLADADRRLRAVEALRAQQAEAADFYCAIDDDVRAAVMLHCAAELRRALND